jgi:hypothetical protein
VAAAVKASAQPAPAAQKILRNNITVSVTARFYRVTCNKIANRYRPPRVGSRSCEAVSFSFFWVEVSIITSEFGLDAAQPKNPSGIRQRVKCTFKTYPT